MMKDFGCECGEKDPQKFYATYKSKCKECVRAIERARYKPTQSEYNQKCKERARIRRSKFTPEQLAEYKAYHARADKIWKDKNILRTRYLCARNNSPKRGLEFSITFEDVEQLWDSQNGRCYYSDIPMSMTDGPNGVSIDRMDSTKGYTIDNIVLTTWRINHMKGISTYEEFIETIRTILEHHK